MVVKIDAAQTPRGIGYFEGIHHPFKTVKRPIPQVGIQIFVYHRCIDLQAAAGRPEQGVKPGQRRVSSGNIGFSAVNVCHAGSVGNPNRIRAG